MKTSAFEAYTNPAFTMPVIAARGGEVTTEPISLDIAQFMLGDGLPANMQLGFAETAEELYSSIQPVQVSEHGTEYQFEFGFVRAKEPATGENHRTKLKGVSYQGSLTENKGNGAEVILDALAEPGVDIVYGASIGMGLSRAMTSAERKYVRKYGRLLIEDEKGIARPLPVVRAYGNAIAELGFEPNELYSDSAGALMNTAYGATVAAGRITRSHQNVRTGIWDKNIFQLAKGMMHDDTAISKLLTTDSPDALKMSPQLVDLVNANVGQKYAAANFQPSKSVPMLLTYAIGLGRGPKHGDPLVQDNIALVRANPEVDVLFTVGSKDALAANENLEARLRNIVRKISEQGGNKIMAAVLQECGHGPQTYAPQLIRAISRAALGR